MEAPYHLATSVISRILYGPSNQKTYDEIWNLLQQLDSPNFVVQAPEIRSRYGILTNYTTPLIAAILRGDPNIINLILADNADINYSEGRVIGTPLDYALYMNNLPLADYFLENGAESANLVTPSQEERTRRYNFFRTHPQSREVQTAKERFAGNVLQLEGRKRERR